MTRGPWISGCPAVFPSTDALLSVRRMVMLVRQNGWVNWSGLATTLMQLDDVPVACWIASFVGVTEGGIVAKREASSLGKLPPAFYEIAGEIDGRLRG